MTAGTTASDGVTCRRCSHQNQSGDHYCESCGSSIVAMPLPRSGDADGQQGRPGRSAAPASAGEDATTRFLCAAAQLDRGFADEAIAEYLVERVRAVPPSPGVDSAAVLREAVAARARRRIRDAVLLVLFVLFVVANVQLAIIWLVVALVVALVAALVGVGFVGASQGRSRRSTLMAVGLVGGALVLATLMPGLFGLSSGDFLSFGQRSSLGFVFSLLLGIVIIGIVAVDEFAVEYLTRTRFRRGVFVPDAQHSPNGWERFLRTLGHQHFRPELERVAVADERGAHARNQADVIVHRGRSPFVGAGVTVDGTVIALPLQPAKDSTGQKVEPRPISVVELHRHVADVLVGLRTSSSLAPSRRLEGLVVREQVLIPADRLVMNLHEQPGPVILGNLNLPPAAHLPLADARRLADAPQEWARYYRCFRIEAWDRDLTASCYFYVGTDQQMLYLEWTHCLLLPIKEQYREIDRAVENGSGTFGRTVVECLLLPVSVPGRLGSVFHRFRSLKQCYGEILPERYGAARSLRELAADGNIQTYFQQADAVRYQKIVDRALFRAVGQFLEERGYSVVDFMNVASAAITNSLTIHGGSFSNVAMGIGDTQQGTAGNEKKESS